MRIAVLPSNGSLTALYHLSKTAAADLVSFGRAVNEGRAIRLLQKNACEPEPQVFGNYSGGTPGTWYVRGVSLTENGPLVISTLQFSV